MIRRRRHRQIERALQQEIALRLKMAGVLFVPVPNGVWLPAHTPAERELVKRIIHQMKQQGSLVPGAPDGIVMRDGKAGCIEFKREAAVDVLGHKTPAGKSSDEQKEFRARAEEAGVPYAICSNWEDVRNCLTEWGMLNA